MAASFTKISSLTDKSLILEDRINSSGFPRAGLYIKGRTSTLSPQFYIGYPPTTEYTTPSTPPFILTGQEVDKTLLVFSLNNQAMTAFRSDFDGNDHSANKLHIDSRGVPVMTITGKGYVGIGTENPLGPFHVEGTMYVDGEVYAYSTISDVDTEGRPLSVGFKVGGTGEPIVRTEFPSFGTSQPQFKFSFPDTTLPAKNFVILHPLDKQRYLVHTALEGPENGVRYRGHVSLKDGKAQIVLPDYVPEITDPETATLHLQVDGTGESVRVVYKKGQWLRNGRISIESENKDSGEEVSWTLQLTRTDLIPLQVTPPKNLVNIEGTGPYKVVKARLYQ